ncbi:EEF1A lysine methyltransferase 4 [Cyprinodon tularosa]|uniref:EEF1A lysine methyltransferase 4 n=1 Tax=Cyprinodon tularosa TaxID=77115 RepID=UPI0018E22ACF|nr:EEF1A lysine methyltransferase 4 [Cyprinodon tularosa]
MRRLLSVDIPLHSPLISKQDPKILSPLHFRQGLSSNQSTWHQDTIGRRLMIDFVFISSDCLPHILDTLVELDTLEEEEVGYFGQAQLSSGGPQGMLTNLALFLGITSEVSTAVTHMFSLFLNIKGFVGADSRPPLPYPTIDGLEGCGNSGLSGDIYNAGYHAITNIDYSSVCIGLMSARYSSHPGMTWHQMDVRQLSFPDASFDVILEKATLDAIMVEEKSPWEVTPETLCFIHQALTEISRCLRPGGRFVSITFAQPFFRKRLYARTEYNWSVRHDSYGEGFEYFVYVMTKGEQLSPEDAALENKLLEEFKSQPTSIPTHQDEDDNDFLSNINL